MTPLKYSGRSSFVVRMRLWRSSAAVGAARHGARFFRAPSVFLDRDMIRRLSLQSTRNIRRNADLLISAWLICGPSTKSIPIPVEFLCLRRFDLLLGRLKREARRCIDQIIPTKLLSESLVFCSESQRLVSFLSSVCVAKYSVVLFFILYLLMLEMFCVLYYTSSFLMLDIFSVFCMRKFFQPVYMFL